MAEKSVMKTEDRPEKLRNIIVTEVPIYPQANGHQGNIVITDCSVAKVKRSEIGFHAASEMYSGKIKLKQQLNEEIIEKVENVIVKAMPGKNFVRQLQNSEDQFFNEKVLYSSVVPLLLKLCTSENSKSEHLNSVSELFPKCFYASNDAEKGMLVFEDLRDAGYKIGGGQDMLMDYDHILIAVEGLARFHALSYAAKLKDPKKFQEKVGKISRDSKRYFAERKSSDGVEWSYIVYIRFTTRLLLDKFFEENGELSALSEKLNKLIKKVSELQDFGELLKDQLTPEEPLSVLSHGDFNMNNMLFRYDSNNKPVGVKFLDFQNMRYCSPMIDLCFMVYTNSSPELRADHWEHLFKSYHNTILEALSEFADCPIEALLPTFSLEMFEEEYAKYCLYGFIFASNFIISSAALGIKDDPFDNMEHREWGVVESEKFMQGTLIVESDELKKRLYPLVREVLEKLKI